MRVSNGPEKGHTGGLKSSMHATRPYIGTSRIPCKRHELFEAWTACTSHFASSRPNSAASSAILPRVGCINALRRLQRFDQLKQSKHRTLRPSGVSVLISMRVHFLQRQVQQPETLLRLTAPLRKAQSGFTRAHESAFVPCQSQEVTITAELTN